MAFGISTISVICNNCLCHYIVEGITLTIIISQLLPIYAVITLDRMLMTAIGSDNGIILALIER